MTLPPRVSSLFLFTGKWSTAGSCVETLINHFGILFFSDEYGRGGLGDAAARWLTTQAPITDEPGGCEVWLPSVLCSDNTCVDSAFGTSQ